MLGPGTVSCSVICPCVGQKSGKGSQQQGKTGGGGGGWGFNIMKYILPKKKKEAHLPDDKKEPTSVCLVLYLPIVGDVSTQFLGVVFLVFTCMYCETTSSFIEQLKCRTVITFNIICFQIIWDEEKKKWIDLTADEEVESQCHVYIYPNTIHVEIDIINFLYMLVRLHVSLFLSPKDQSGPPPPPTDTELSQKRPTTAVAPPSGGGGGGGPPPPLPPSSSSSSSQPGPRPGPGPASVAGGPSGLADSAGGIDTTGQGASKNLYSCLLYTSPSPRDATLSRMPSSA